MTLPDDIAGQINRVPQNRNRPLLICDADEVLLQFARTLEAFLDDAGYALHLESFRLHGNVRDARTGLPADADTVTTLLQRFFLERVAQCPPVDGAVGALETLSARADIVVLTNVPMAALEARRNAMAAYGLAYPVIANTGGKGPAVRALAGERQAPVIFMDDLPSNHASVADHAGHVHRVHFVADPRLGPLIGASDHAHTRIDHWPAAQQYLDRHLRNAGF